MRGKKPGDMCLLLLALVSASARAARANDRTDSAADALSKRLNSTSQYAIMTATEPRELEVPAPNTGATADATLRTERARSGRAAVPAHSRNAEDGTSIDRRSTKTRDDGELHFFENFTPSCLHHNGFYDGRSNGMHLVGNELMHPPTGRLLDANQASMHICM